MMSSSENKALRAENARLRGEPVDQHPMHRYVEMAGSEPSQQMWRALGSLSAQRLECARSSVVVAIDSE